MSEFNCVWCNVTVTSADREQHSASASHADNGGSPTVVDDDYELADDSPGTTDQPSGPEPAPEPETGTPVTRGMGQTK